MVRYLGRFVLELDCCCTSMRLKPCQSLDGVAHTQHHNKKRPKLMCTLTCAHSQQLRYFLLWWSVMACPCEIVCVPSKVVEAWMQKSKTLELSFYDSDQTKLLVRFCLGFVKILRSDAYAGPRRHERVHNITCPFLSVGGSIAVAIEGMPFGP